MLSREKLQGGAAPLQLLDESSQLQNQQQCGCPQAPKPFTLKHNYILSTFCAHFVHSTYLWYTVYTVLHSALNTFTPNPTFLHPSIESVLFIILLIHFILSVEAH